MKSGVMEKSNKVAEKAVTAIRAATVGNLDNFFYR